MPDAVKFHANKLLSGQWDPYPIDMAFQPPCMVGGVHGADPWLPDVISPELGCFCADLLPELFAALVLQFSCGQLLMPRAEHGLHVLTIPAAAAADCILSAHQTISKIGLAQPGKIMRGTTADNCERHLHQLHVCAPSKKGTYGPVVIKHGVHTSSCSQAMIPQMNLQHRAGSRCLRLTLCRLYRGVCTESFVF